MKKRRFLNGWTLITAACFLFFLFFFLYPISRIFINSVYNFETGTFSMKSFVKFFTKRYYTNTVWNSLKVTSLATLSTAFFGGTLAYLARTIRLRGKRVLDIVMLISVLSPPFIGAYSWIVLLGRAGVVTEFINKLFGIQFEGIYGFSGILLVFTIKLSPLVYLYVSGALKNLDNSLNEASESMGCRGVRKIVTVILPLILPTLLASALLVFMRALADFGTPMLIGEGYRTLPVLIYNSFIGEVSQDHSFAAAISVIIVAFTTAIFLLQRWVAGRVNIEMSSMNPLEPKKATGIRNVLAHAYAYVFILLELLPIIVVTFNSFQNTQGSMFVEGFSLTSYVKAFNSMGSSIANTYMYSIAALFIILVIGILVSYSSVRRPSVLTAVLDTTTMFPYIIPGSVLGISMLLAFNKPPLTLSGTAMIIIAAYVIRRLPYTIRSSSAILRQISPSVEEASQSLGANGAETFVKVTVPMMISGVLPGALMSWMSIISELSASIMLYVGTTKTMTISIYTEVIRGNFGVASALSTILILSTIVVLLTFFKLTGRSEIEL
ncbi:MAG: iron ABC transporter permease [Clostridia bacterium]|nr:iron ABC transporter permease [Clostridia bacterium]